MFRILALEILTPPEDSLVVNGELSSQSYPSEVMDFAKHIKEIKQARYDSVTRILKDGVDKTFYFYHDVKIKDGRVMRKKDSQFFEDFYTKRKTHVSISAIVGQNGSGKSTILDIVLRMLNNVAYALYEGVDNNDSYELSYAECVFAKLYIETDKDELWVIEQEDHDIHLYDSNTHKYLWHFNNQADKGAYFYNDKHEKRYLDIASCRTYLSDLFYTIVINHAAYAYNITDYRSEWIDNDEKNTIDEHRISTNGNTETINQIARKQDEELCWIGALFHKNDSYQTPIVLNPYRMRGIIDFNREKDLLNERLFLMLNYNRDVVTEMLNGKVPYQYQFYKIGDFVPTRIEDGYWGCKKVIDALGDLNCFESTVRDPKYPRGYKTTTLDGESRRKFITEISKNIINAWQRCCGYRFYPENMQLGIEQNVDVLAAMNYLVYKTIKCTYYYSDYRAYQENIKNNSNIEDLVKDLYCNDSNITLKLRRALAFLLFHHYGSRRTIGTETTRIMNLDEFDEKIDKIAKLTEYEEEMNLKFTPGVSNKFKKDDYGNKKPHDKWLKEELMPGGFLQTVLVLQYADKTLGKFDHLSSGEKQQIYTISSMVYQLHHLNSAGKGKIQYRNANIIFDEVDLYFHPDYQKKMVDYVLRVVDKLKLENIRNINIMMATHSPFILSDIQKNNILYLENGNDVSNKVAINPLGANISDVLSQSFFLKDGFIGDFIKTKLNRMVDDLSSKKYVQEGKLEQYEKLIMNIGEPLLREHLSMMFIEKKYNMDGNKIDSLMKYLKKNKKK